VKLAFGDHVHCIFAEPTRSPCMLLGVYTGLHDEVAVQDFGIDNVTAADGLAVGRPSGFVGKAMHRLIDGYFTIGDEEMHALLALLHETEAIDLEPSAVAGLAGAARVLASDQAEYRFRAGLSDDMLERATHFAWATGGSMVPKVEMDAYVEKGRQALTAIPRDAR
jgi:D-serine dehydratase